MSDTTTLEIWLSRDQSALSNAIVDAVSKHVAELASRGVDFYGYALLPGEPYDINSLVAVSNCESDIKVQPDDDDYRYYRFSVDEWADWQHDGFDHVNELLVRANSEFLKLHSKNNDDCEMDRFEIIHSRSLLQTIVQGLKNAKENGVFASKDQFLVVWISDSGDQIISESVHQLNSAAVAQEFMTEFGSNF